jgi:hypothetical protein
MLLASNRLYRRVIRGDEIVLDGNEIERERRQRCITVLESFGNGSNVPGDLQRIQQVYICAAV